MKRVNFLETLLVLLIIKINRSFTSGVSDNAHKIVHFDVLQSCKPNMTVDITNVVLSDDGNRKTMINATFQVRRDINANLQQFLKVFRCKSKDNPDTCIEMANMKITGNGCNFFVAKNQIWSPFFGNTQPIFKCPLKKGNYSIINGWFDGDHEPFPFPLNKNSYWKAFFKVFEKPRNVQVMCLHYEGIVIPIKS